MWQSWWFVLSIYIWYFLFAIPKWHTQVQKSVSQILKSFAYAHRQWNSFIKQPVTLQGRCPWAPYVNYKMVCCKLTLLVIKHCYLNTKPLICYITPSLKLKFQSHLNFLHFNPYCCRIINIPWDCCGIIYIPWDCRGIIDSWTLALQLVIIHQCKL